MTKHTNAIINEFREKFTYPGKGKLWKKIGTTPEDFESFLKEECEKLEAAVREEDKKQLLNSLNFHRSNEREFRSKIKDSYGAMMVEDDFNKMIKLVKEYYAHVRHSQKEEGGE